MKLKEAQIIANKYLELLQPYCDKIFIAGSIRRLKPEVKDIEIVCIPKKIKPQFQGFFDEENGLVIHPEFISTVNTLAKQKGEPTGKYTQRKLKEGIVLDLFIPDDFDFMRQYAIRTGSADYVKRYIAGGWRAKGWCGSDIGLRKMSDCEKIPTPDGKGKWKCTNPNAELPPNWKSEEEFFEWLGVKYLPPNERI